MRVELQFVVCTQWRFFTGYHKSCSSWILLTLLLPVPGSSDLSFSPVPRQYTVLLPFLIHTDSPEKVCVQLTHLNESVTLSATLEYQGENRSLIDDVVSEKDVFTCIPFSLPKSNSWSSVVFLTVTVKGATLQFRSRKSVLVKNYESLVFIQTDKPIYKPGQTVLFRIVSLDKDFRPLNEMDPKQNRLYQWTKAELKMGLIQLFFNLTSEPIQGTYRVVAQKASGKTVQHPFSVEEYVLPKFEVIVKMPKVITILDEKLKVTVCGLYTFGKPVPGLVSFRVCRKFKHPATTCYGEEAKAVCDEFSGQTDNHGCISEMVKTKLFQLKRNGYENKLHVEAKIKEEETGVELTGTSFSEITTTITKITFENPDTHYKPGIPFFGQTAFLLKYRTYQTFNIRPWILTSVFEYLCVYFLLFQATHKIHPYCYDHSWIVPYYEEGYLQLRRFYSPSNSYLKIEPKSKALSCGSSTEVRVHYVLTPEAIGEQKKIVFYYLVSLHLPYSEEDGEFLSPLPVQADIAPVAQMFVYTTSPSRELIADSMKFNIEKCFKNKVDLSFSPSEGLPSSDAHLLFRASPYSLCAVRAVDKSVLLMKPEADLSPSSVTLTMKFRCCWYQCSLQPQQTSAASTAPDCHIDCDFLRPKHNDNVDLPCLELSVVDFFSILLDSGPLAGRLYPSSSTPELLTETVRKYFPETWIWSLVPISSEGNAGLGMIIPDTITEWKANAFCISPDTGFGLSPTVTLRAFQPFFVELTMPYSVVRGESFTLKATVFNYLTTCIRVSVTLAQSTHFLATLVEKEEESYCLCENGRKTVAWLVTPKSLGQVEFSVSTEALQNKQPCGNAIVETPEKGRKDTVIRQLLVEVCGYLGLVSFSGEPVEEKFFLLLPSNVVRDSGRAYFSVLGDIMGTAMQNLHQLLQMPFGCGEQNMVLFAPNIYVLDYLNKTGQLSEEVKSKAIGYLVSGYQRQLNYKHPDGSYSTFGPRYGQPGNTWLTAFVLKSFAQARPHIFIDEKHIQDALVWLSYKQKENGCFRSSGTLLNNAMKGGVDNEVSLTAYITIALLEIPLPVTHSVVRNALFCLEMAAGEKENHVYTKALMAYAFALAGKEEKRKALLTSLEREAVKKDGSVHWQRPGKEPEVALPYYRSRAPSAEVEMTSYVLLAHLTAQPAPSQEELSFAALIAKWISTQQNPNGGFSSTQDTVVALQALSLYGAVTYAKSGAASKVTLRSGGDFQQDFQVDPHNRLLLQRVPLPRVPGEYSTEVSGEGCVYLQVRVMGACGTLGGQPLTRGKRRVEVHCTFVACFLSYTGERNGSNMVIVDVKMLSGFIPVKSSVRKVGLSSETLSFSFAVEQDIPVQGLKPAQVKVYDYYETDEFATQEYSAPCTTGKVHRNN
uniref:Alpha-2-macroglobulin n=1 Tax=Strigops habroptila TaxID=2489341 RepID=A0A672V329_STRHB